MNEPEVRTVREAPQSGLTTTELLQKATFKQTEPSEIFGEDGACLMLDDPAAQESALPYVKTFDPVASALYGQPVDSWGRLGAHYSNRLPIFQSFENLTNGLPLEKKVRCFVILLIYVLDMRQRRSQLARDMFSLETLDQCRDWIGFLLQSADSETKLAVAALGGEEGIDEDMARIILTYTHDAIPVKPSSTAPAIEPAPIEGHTLIQAARAPVRNFIAELLAKMRRK